MNLKVHCKLRNERRSYKFYNIMNNTSTECRPFEECSSEQKIRTCMLLVTHGCNLNCTYCYEKFKNATKIMDIELAKQIIMQDANRVKMNDNEDCLDIEFMGGEPLLRFDLIKNIVEWVKDGALDVPLICYATTNATLLNDEMKQWFRENKDFIVLGASFDGVHGSQSTNRGEKAESIDLDFFKETWPFQGFKMTISKESLPYLYESFVYVAEHGYKVHASLAHGVDWNIEDAEVLFSELKKLSAFYLNNPQYVPCNFLTKCMSGVGKIKEAQMRFCGSGTHMTAYDVDGTKYGCHMFSPLVLGKNAVKLEDIKDWSDREFFTDSTCKGCGLSEWCPTCIGFNMLTRGAVDRRDHRWCSMVAAQALVACEFQLEYFAKLTPRAELTENEGITLKAALQAYNYLKNIDFRKPFPQ